MKCPYVILFGLFAALCGSVAFAQSALVVLPITGENQLVLTPATLGILVNANDPASVELGLRYAEIRGVPPANIVELHLPRVKYVVQNLMMREIQKLKEAPNYQRMAAFALAFDQPYRVGSNQSVTSAIAQGISTKTWQGACNITDFNPDTTAPPGAPLQSKPAMLLSVGGGLADSINLAERGKQADASDPAGQIFLVKTEDAARSQPREASMDRAFSRFAPEIGMTVTKSGGLADQSGIMGYQIGIARLGRLETLHFLPGSFADHLTSFGGELADNTSQTTISALLQAGATASFGTVREPCNFPAKFPDPEKMLGNYLRGDSLLEAYWKSVAMTTEGLFMGEPLARPFPVLDARLDGDRVTIRANRHTVGYLDHSQTTEQKDSEQKVEAATTSLRIYAVQSGTPQFLHAIILSHDANLSAISDTFQVPNSDLMGLMLGVLKQ